MTTDIAIRPDYVDEHIFEDYDENSSARLFERSRIKALAAAFHVGGFVCSIFESPC
ncbi:hypothetical protein T06_1156 [Trichinella sp. T6]|nr:hypothetical protein T06_1156 [Trichinella sp. T6]